MTMTEFLKQIDVLLEYWLTCIFVEVISATCFHWNSKISNVETHLQEKNEYLHALKIISE